MNTAGPVIEPAAEPVTESASAEARVPDNGPLPKRDHNRGNAPAGPGVAQGGGRILSIDILRGLVMVLMTLDHVRGQVSWLAAKHFPGQFALPRDPTALESGSALFFWMRWVTHFCAPVFIFLAGMSAYLWSSRKGRERGLSRYLLTRGFFLAGLNILISSGSPFSQGGWIVLDVLWPIGLSMVLLGCTVHLPRPLLWFVGLGIVFGQNALVDLVRFAPGAGDVLWRLAFVKSSFDLPWGAHLVALYPVVPWYGVMTLGYLFAFRFTKSAARERTLVCLGAACVAAFILLRSTGVYGDLTLWRQYEYGWQTVAAFFNTTKYPPSLQYLCMTLGPMFLALAALNRVDASRAGGPVTRFLLVLGGVPLMYYVAHKLLIEQLGPLLFSSSGGEAGPLLSALCSAPGIFAASALVLALLYPACLWWKGRARRARTAEGGSERSGERT